MKILAKQAREKVWDFISKGQPLSLQSRIYRLLCLSQAVIILGICEPTNLLEPDLPLAVHVLATLCGLVGLVFFILARQGREYPVLFLSQMIVFLDAIWPFGGGATGSDTYFFLTVIVYPPVLFRGFWRWLMTGLIIASVGGLFAFEYFHPGLIYRFPNHDEAMFDCFISVLSSAIATTAIILIVVTCYDFEKKQLANYASELNKSEENYRLVVENAPCIILRLDAGGRILFLNKFARNLFGIKAEEIIGSSALGIIMPRVSANGEAKAAEFEDMLRRPEAHRHFQAESLSRDGRWIWISWANVPKYDESGRLSELLCVGSDLTEVKEAEEKRRQQEVKMQHRERMESLGLLAGGIAHDFNNLLMPIMGNISMIKMDVPKEGRLFKLVDAAERASLHARDITSRLLVFAKGGKPVKRILDVKKTIEDSIGLAFNKTNEACCRVDLQMGDDLMPIEADPAQLTQAFNNLLLNACQAMTERGVVTIQARNQMVIQPDHHALPAGEYVEIMVRDNGRGIAPHDLAKIFDPYFTTKKTGSGLGLAVVHSVIQNHGGSISVQSTPGVGTTFTILLPKAVEGGTVPRRIPKAAAVGGRRLLVMDDDGMVRNTLVNMTTRLGFQVETVAAGNAALERYQQATAEKKPFDLVLMDLNIVGGMGGLETLQRLLSVAPEARVVASSGYLDNPVMSDYAAHGFKGILVKPYTAEQLQQVIQTVMAG